MRLNRPTLIAVCSAVTTLVLALGPAGCGGGSDPTGSVTGYIYDDSMLTPVQGVSVQVTGGTSALTSNNGAFTVTGVATGTRTFSAFKAGYQTLNFQASVSGGSSNVGTKFIAPSATPGLGSIVGTVLDTGSPVSGALVVAGGKSAYTKADGSYALYNITPGTVLVTAQSGARIGRVSAAVSSGASVTANVGISVSPPLPPVI